MSMGTRSTVSRKSLVGLALVFILCSLLLTMGACDSLTSDTTAAPTTTIEVVATETTAAVALLTEASLYGSWDGTYAVLQVWDQNGVVDESPVPVNTPLQMHLELHALSAATGDCGTVEVPGFGSSRVTALSTSGQEVHLSIISEAPGRADLHSTFNLTLQGDTLTGEDSGDPNVPSGWVSTSGTISLRRSGS